MTDRETEPGTLPEGIEQQIEKWRQARMYTDPRTGDVLLCSLSLIGYVSDLRSIARAAYAEGAAHERARIVADIRKRWDGHEALLILDMLEASRTPLPPPEAQE